jgi:FtsH-binding integral membrane protein
MSLEMDVESDEGSKGAIMGVLALYLDFINMFIFMLRIFGDRK